MAKIIVNVPADRATEHLEEVVGHIENGMTSGHWNADTNWDVEFDSAENADDLR